MNIMPGTPKCVTIHDPSKAYKGYTLFGTSGSKHLWLADMEGRIVHHWVRPSFPGFHYKLLPNGNVMIDIRIVEGPMGDMSGAGGIIAEMDWNGNITWQYKDLYNNGHDYLRMDNGNTLLTHWKALPDDVAAKVKGGVPGTEWQGHMWDDVIQEITPEGKIVWEWETHKQLNFDKDIMCPLCPRHSWSYINSVDAAPNGDILISMRQINTIAIIDRKTGKFKWRWGQGELGHQHNPTFMSDGNVLVFDNGTHRQRYDADRACSRVVEINPKTSKIEWEFEAEDKLSFYSAVCANTQRLPNGNTLICEATRGRIFEVTPEKEVVWEFINPFRTYYRAGMFGKTNIMYRAYRYGVDYEGLRGKDLDPEKFEWSLQEKGKEGYPLSSPPDQELLADERLRKLGY